MSIDAILWTAFGLVVGAALAVDLGVFQRHAHVVRSREALAWSIAWVALALAFNGAIAWFKGGGAAAEFLAGYLIEKSLSVDNIFLFLLIFSSMAVPREHEARILLWGIIGALVLRAVFVVLGAALLESFHWMIYIFGGLLICTGVKMLVKPESVPNPAGNVLVRLIRRIIPVSHDLDGQRFFTRVDGKLAATPLFIALLVIETTDVIFAVDSVPAIFAVTSDPFIVYTSNVFAILGLRSMYFLLGSLVAQFRYLKPALVMILWFVGAKLMLSDVVKIPVTVSLATIGGILALAIVLSLLRPAPSSLARKEEVHGES